MPPATWPCDQISGIVAELTETHQSPSKGGPRKPHSRAGSGGVTSICCPVANSPVTVFVPFQPVHSNPARTPLCIVTVMFDSVKFSIGCHKRRTCSANTSELAQTSSQSRKQGEEDGASTCSASVKIMDGAITSVSTTSLMSRFLMTGVPVALVGPRLWLYPVPWFSPKPKSAVAKFP